MPVIPFIPAIAAVAGAALSANASSKASKAQTAAANQAAEQSDRQFETTRTDQLAQLAQQREDAAPYRAAGTESLRKLMEGTSAGGEFTQEYQRKDFAEDPGYKFRLEEGEAGIERQAAANGSKYSGAVLKALSRFNSGLASQEYGAYNDRENQAQTLFEGSKTNRFNRLSSLAGNGQTANQALASAGQAVNSNIASLSNANATRMGGYAQDAGEARASGYVGVSNAIGQGIKGLVDNYPRAGSTG